MIEIVVLDRLAMGDDLDFSVLENLGLLTIYDTTEPEQVVERVKTCDFILTNKVRITSDIMKEAKHLKLVCVFATGYDNIDVDYAREQKISVCNIPAYSTESVTLFTIATVLSLITSLPKFQSYITSGEYSFGTSPNRIKPTYHEMYGKTWGIIGCGTIGTRVGEIARSFGCRVITYQRHKHNLFDTVSLETLLNESDIISIHCPLNPQTRHLIGENELSMMKKTVILVNEARGAVCDEEAVARAIKNKEIFAFGCDVYSVEPFPTTHPMYEIRNYENVCLTPHAAWAAYEARVRALQIVYENMYSFITGTGKNRVV